MHCEADLLSDGWIQWQGQKFSSPYAWASQCKNDVNPNHKSGIGWGHVSIIKNKICGKHTCTSEKKFIQNLALCSYNECIECIPSFLDSCSQ